MKKHKIETMETPNRLLCPITMVPKNGPDTDGWTYLTHFQQDNPFYSREIFFKSNGTLTFPGLFHFLKSDPLKNDTFKE